MANRSAKQSHFSVVPSVNVRRSTFSRPFRHLTTFDFGWLIPIYWTEILPGDTMKFDLTVFARLATPIKPIMDNLYWDAHWFFCPNRLVMDNWVKLQGERDNPDDDIDYTVPQMQAPASTGYTLAANPLQFYFGLPIGAPDIRHSALPFRMYNLIYNTFYKDQNLIDNVVVDKDDADSAVADYVLLKRNKQRDYFTSCLPFPQKGDAVLLPLGDTAPVIGLGTQDQVFPQSGSYYEGDGIARAYSHAKQIGDATWGNNNLVFIEGDAATSGKHMVRVDLTQATAANINDLREAFAIQRLLERDARGGTRYPEVLRSQYSVIDPSYAVMQRPVYLGGMSQRFNVTPIPQQSVTSTTPQGNLAGMGTSSGTGRIVKSFTEHGLVICILSCRADLTYQQGLEKYWTKKTRYDFYMPVFANLGEQPVLTQEIYCQAPTVDTGSTGTPDNLKIFGYQEAWADYRYSVSRITGLFNSKVPSKIDMWHVAQEFSSLPTLGKDFIEENCPVDRVIATPTEPHVIADILVENSATRPMPVYSVPGLIDHL